MDTKKKLSKFSHNNQFSEANVRRLKSITTQTDESSTYYSQHNMNETHFGNSNQYQNNNVFNGSDNEKRQSAWGRSHECLSLCAACSHTMTTYNAHMSQPFQMPWYSAPAPLCFNGNLLPMGLPQRPPPSFMQMPLLPYRLPPLHTNSFATTSPHHHNPIRTNHGPDSVRGSVIGDNPNINNHGNCLNPNYIRLPHKPHKSKTTYIRSEPNVTRYDLTKYMGSHVKQKETTTNTTNSISRNMNSDDIKLSHNGSTKSLPKSDTCISNNDKYPYNCKLHTDVYNNVEQLKRTSYYLNKADRFATKSDDTKSDTKRDVLKSPIYKYADLRIHEMSSNLKDIKDNIVKLSSKASELNINEPSAEADNSHLSKYFKSVYNELKAKDATYQSMSNPCSLGNSTSNLNSNYTSLNSMYNTSTDDNQQTPRSLSFVSRDVNNISSTSITATYNVSSDTNNDCTSPAHVEPLNEIYNNQTKTQTPNDQINVMKRTRPLRDISKALLSNQLQTEQETASATKSTDKTKLRRINSDKIMAHVLVQPERQTISGCNMGDCSVQEDGDCGLSKLNYIQKRKRISKLNRQYANISFVNYDSLSDEEQCAVAVAGDTYVDAPSDTSDSTASDQMIVSEKHLSRYFQLDPDGFKAYTEVLQIDNDVEEEIEITVGNTITGVVAINANNSDKKMTMMNVEKWLQKNAETLNNNDHKQIAIITTTLQPNKRHSQFSALNNLEVLSKISEEDEEKFSGVAPDAATTIKSVSKPNKLVNKDLLHGDSVRTITKASRISEPHIKQVNSDQHIFDGTNIYLQHKFANTWIQ